MRKILQHNVIYHTAIFNTQTKESQKLSQLLLLSDVTLQLRPRAIGKLHQSYCDPAHETEIKTLWKQWTKPLLPFN